jgi:hypothetical protein
LLFSHFSSLHRPITSIYSTHYYCPPHFFFLFVIDSQEYDVADRERVAAAHAQTNALQTRRLTALELRIKFLQEQVISAKTNQPQQSQQPTLTTAPTAAVAASSPASSTAGGKAVGREAAQLHQHSTASAATSPTSLAEAESEEWGCELP